MITCKQIWSEICKLPTWHQKVVYEELRGKYKTNELKFESKEFADLLDKHMQMNIVNANPKYQYNDDKLLETLYDISYDDMKVFHRAITQ
jgi:hypothetical protein